MKTKSYLIMIAAVMLSCCCLSAQCEGGSEAVIIPGEEWSWSRGAYNSFSGKIGLEDCKGRELTICISTDLPYSDESDEQSLPVFTSVNGKRIVMTKQSDMVHFTPDSDNQIMSFTASFRLPEKLHVSSVSVTFRISDTDGKELKTVSGRIDSGEETSGQSETPFYIPADINLITLVLAGAALTVWLAALIRHFRRKKKQTGV